MQYNVHGEPGQRGRGRGRRIRERRAEAGRHGIEKTRVTRYATPTYGMILRPNLKADPRKMDQSIESNHGK
jgi:hypothetical protein